MTNKPEAKVYRFTERRQAATAASSLVLSDKVQDTRVVVFPELVYIQVWLTSDSPENQAWLTGVMGVAGQERIAGNLFGNKDAQELYNNKEGVKHFRGYSWSVYKKLGIKRKIIANIAEKALTK